MFKIDVHGEEYFSRAHTNNVRFIALKRIFLFTFFHRISRFARYICGINMMFIWENFTAAKHILDWMKIPHLTSSNIYRHIRTHALNHSPTMKSESKRDDNHWIMGCWMKMCTFKTTHASVCVHLFVCLSAANMRCWLRNEENFMINFISARINFAGINLHEAEYDLHATVISTRC